MRLFTAIALPEEVTAQLARLIEHLRTTAHVRWSPVYNLHITTKFIGEWPEARLAELVERLQSVPPPGAIDISVRGFGWFPNPHRPRVLFVGVHAPAELKALTAATDDAAAGLGVAREDKPFSPHLTIARIKEPVPLDKLKRAIAELKSDDFGTFTADHFHLYLSKPGPAGSIYTALGDFPLLRR